jgi:transposase, IS30 family
MPFQHLKREERYVIYHLVVFGLSNREIARRLRRAPSTVAREIKRNSGTFNYFHEIAQEKCDKRASSAHRGRRSRPRALFRYVEAGLCEGWSPEMSTRRLRREFPRQEDLRVSHETIYQWVYRDAKEGGEAYRCLRRRHSRRRRQRTRLKVLGCIAGRIGSEARPVIVNLRRRFERLGERYPCKGRHEAAADWPPMSKGRAAIWSQPGFSIVPPKPLRVRALKP